MRQAAHDGNVMAENRLAHLYRAGIGTKQDRVAAGTWYILSRRAGLQDNTLEDFFQGLTDEQQKEALKKANDIQAQ
jgi:TPR repeat protein